MRADPYERADITSNTYYDWVLSQVYLFGLGQKETALFLMTFKDYPPSQRAATFSIDQMQEKLNQLFERLHLQ